MQTKQFLNFTDRLSSITVEMFDNGKINLRTVITSRIDFFENDYIYMIAIFNADTISTIGIRVNLAL